MGGMSRRKGSRGELELVQELNRRGLLCRRTVQYCGRSGDAADVVCEGMNIHLESKRCERFRLYDAIRQASRDAKGRPFAIAHRSNGEPWVVVMLLEHWIADSVQCANAIALRRERVESVDPPEDL